LQQEAKEREDRHTALARKSRARKRNTAELEASGDTQSSSAKKLRLENDDGSTKKPSLDNSVSPQSSVTATEPDNVSPSSSDGLKSPGALKRKAYTPLRTQYCLRETVVPIQPLSFEQHGKGESPSKITRRISSTDDTEDPLLPSSNNSKATAKSKSRTGGTKKGKQEEGGGKKKRVSALKEKRTDQEVTTAAASVSAALPVSSPEPIFLTPPLDSTSKVATVSSQVMSTQAAQPTPPYTPTHQMAHVIAAEGEKAQSNSVPASPHDMSTDDLSLTSNSRDTSSSSHDKSPPPNSSKSISMTGFNVDILNNEDDKSALPAVVTIDPNAITHSPVNDTEPTSSVAACVPTEERPFIECTKKTGSIISKSSPKRPSLLPFRKRSLSATSAQVVTRQSLSASGRGRRKSEVGRNNQVCVIIRLL